MIWSGASLHPVFVSLIVLPKLCCPSYMTCIPRCASRKGFFSPSDTLPQNTSWPDKNLKFICPWAVLLPVVWCHRKTHLKLPSTEHWRVACPMNSFAVNIHCKILCSCNDSFEYFLPLFLWVWLRNAVNHESTNCSTPLCHREKNIVLQHLHWIRSFKYWANSLEVHSPPKHKNFETDFQVKY